MAEKIAHPMNPDEVIYGERLRTGDVIESHHVYDSSSGKWEKAPCAGLRIGEGCEAIWVRPAHFNWKGTSHEVGERLKIELIDEITIYDPRYAQILLYDNDKLVAEVHASTEQERGADGGYYHAVKLKKV